MFDVVAPDAPHIFMCYFVAPYSCGVTSGRIGHIVEQVSELKKQGKEVIIVSSGAIAVGKQLLLALHQDASQDQSDVGKTLDAASNSFVASNPRACAAAGQSGLMGLYDMLFRQKHLWSSLPFKTIHSLCGFTQIMHNTTNQNNTFVWPCDV